MAQINVDLNYFDNIKTLRLRARLGAGSDVLPIKLWVHCGRHHPENGVLQGYTEEEIERICGWWGEQGTMVAAMVDLKFLEPSPTGFKVRDWLEHESHLAIFRERARTAAYARWNASSNATSIGKHCLDQNQAMPLHSSTSSTKQSITIPYPIPEPKQSPEDAIIMRFKVLKGVPHDHAEWDMQWERWRPYAKQLLRDCVSYANAYACLEELAGRYTKANLKDWSLRAIAGKAIEWMGNHGGEKHGTANSERFFEALRKQRGMETKNPGLRKSEPPAVLNGLRDIPAAQAETGGDKRGAGNGHEAHVGPLQGPGLERTANGGARGAH